MPIITSIPLCFWCKHFDAEKRDKTNKATCNVFPEVIPLEIWYAEYDHREPHPNDNGIQFEKLEDFSKILTPSLSRLSDEQLERIFNKHADLLTERRKHGIVKPPISDE